MTSYSYQAMSDFEHVEIPGTSERLSSVALNNDSEQIIDSTSEDISKVYKLMVLGTSRAGKSTLINSFQNYLNFETLKEAIECPSGLKFVVPTLFEARGSDKKKVEFREKQSDFNVESTSNFMESKTYRFKIPVKENSNAAIVMEMMEVPWSNDQQSKVQDENDFAMVLEHIKVDPLYNCAIFVVDGTMHTLTPEVREKLQKMLRLIPKSAAQNVTFCFTRSPALSNAYSVIEEVLDETDTNININEANSFAFENKCYQFLVMAKSGCDITQFRPVYSENQCVQHWKDSRAETVRLFHGFVFSRQKVNFMVDSKEDTVKTDDCKTYKLMVIGTSRAGKSTFINSIQNYLSFETLEDAVNCPGKVNCVIPTVFEARGSDKIKAQFREQQSEFNSKMIASNTKDCTTYEFTIPDMDNPDSKFVIELVDTPGINDTEGKEQDEKNFVSILNHIKADPLYNCAVFLIRGSENKLSPEVRENFQNILRIIPKPAAKNVAFCFTGTAGSSDAHSVIEDFLEEIKTDVKIDTENSFDFENKCYQYLVMAKSGCNMSLYKSSHGEIQCRQHWDESRAEMIRLFKDFVTAKKPVNFSEILTLNFCQDLSKQLSGPISQASKLIFEYNQEISNQEERIRETKGNLELLKARPKKKVQEELGLKIISCTNYECGKKECYKTEKGGWGNMSRGWWWFSAAFVNCECGHDDSQHFVKKYRYVDDPKDNDDVKLVNQVVNQVITKEELLRDRKKLKEDNYNELTIMLTSSARIRSFMVRNCLILGYDIVENEIEHQIEEENNDSLKQFLILKLHEYQEMVKEFSKAPVDLKSIEDTKQLLLNLPNNGYLFKDLIESDNSTLLPKAIQSVIINASSLWKDLRVTFKKK
eukprot:NODE_200_length_13167_cov_0.338537.p1 type:complete len:873 gc:universal NODE_200_length_13167_cov_0.338537:11183-8565(-)